MPTQTEIDSLLTSITTAAEGPSEVSSDAGTVKQFSLSELIAAHKYLQNQEIAAQSRHSSGLRFSRLIPPGTVTRGWGR